MSGHNKWSKIKHKKGIEDAKRGKVFSKLAQQIVIASRDGGPDPDANPSLRLLVQKAKAASMPNINVERAIKKGAGTLEGQGALETVFYEGFAPKQVGIIVEGLTDNNNRTVSELRKTFSDNGGSLGEPGSVSWNFARKGYVAVRPAILVESEKYGAEKDVKEKDKDEVMLELMEIAGVTDIQERKDDDGILFLDVYCDPSNFGSVRDALSATDYIIDTAELTYLPNNAKDDLDDSGMERVGTFVDAVEENPDVVNVWTELG